MTSDRRKENKNNDFENMEAKKNILNDKLGDKDKKSIDGDIPQNFGATIYLSEIESQNFENKQKNANISSISCENTLNFKDSSEIITQPITDSRSGHLKRKRVSFSANAQVKHFNVDTSSSSNAVVDNNSTFIPKDIDESMELTTNFTNMIGFIANKKDFCSIEGDMNKKENGEIDNLNKNHNQSYENIQSIKNMDMSEENHQNFNSLNYVNEKPGIRGYTNKNIEKNKGYYLKSHEKDKILKDDIYDFENKDNSTFNEENNNLDNCAKNQFDSASELPINVSKNSKKIADSYSNNKIKSFAKKTNDNKNKNILVSEKSENNIATIIKWEKEPIELDFTAKLRNLNNTHSVVTQDLANNNSDSSKNSDHKDLLNDDISNLLNCSLLESTPNNNVFLEEIEFENEILSKSIEGFDKSHNKKIKENVLKDEIESIFDELDEKITVKNYENLDNKIKKADDVDVENLNNIKGNNIDEIESQVNDYNEKYNQNKIKTNFQFKEDSLQDECKTENIRKLFPNNLTLAQILKNNRLQFLDKKSSFIKRKTISNKMILNPELEIYQEYYVKEMEKYYNDANDTITNLLQEKENDIQVLLKLFVDYDEKLTKIDFKTLKSTSRLAGKNYWYKIRTSWEKKLIEKLSENIYFIDKRLEKPSNENELLQVTKENSELMENIDVLKKDIEELKNKIIASCEKEKSEKASVNLMLQDKIKKNEDNDIQNKSKILGHKKGLSKHSNLKNCSLSIDFPLNNNKFDNNTQNNLIANLESSVMITNNDIEIEKEKFFQKGSEEINEIKNILISRELVLKSECEDLFSNGNLLPSLSFYRKIMKQENKKNKKIYNSLSESYHKTIKENKKLNEIIKSMKIRLKKVDKNILEEEKSKLELIQSVFDSKFIEIRNGKVKLAYEDFNIEVEISLEKNEEDPNIKKMYEFNNSSVSTSIETSNCTFVDENKPNLNPSVERKEKLDENIQKLNKNHKIFKSKIYSKSNLHEKSKEFYKEFLKIISAKKSLSEVVENLNKIYIIHKILNEYILSGDFKTIQDKNTTKIQIFEGDNKLQFNLDTIEIYKNHRYEKINDYSPCLILEYLHNISK